MARHVVSLWAGRASPMCLSSCTCHPLFPFHSMNVPKMLVHDAPVSSQASKHCSSRSRFAILLLPLRLLVVLFALHLGHLVQHVLEMRLDELGEVCLE